VARHIIGQVFFNGDMEKTRCRLLCSFALVVLALVPALAVDNLGIVLSLTGAVGASAIAYIAPGLIYLGVNGEEFLALLDKRVRGGVTTGANCEDHEINDTNMVSSGCHLTKNP